MILCQNHFQRAMRVARGASWVTTVRYIFFFSSVLSNKEMKRQVQEPEPEDICGEHEFLLYRHRIVGEGAEGNIYEACRVSPSKDTSSAPAPCEFVVKEIGLYAPTAIDEIASRYGIGPHVLVKRCPEKHPKTYLIQQKLDGTLREYLDRFPFSSTDQQQVADLVFRSLFELQIFHNDLHVDNIMYRKQKQTRPRFYLIDFSTAVPFDTIGYKTFDRLLSKHQTMQSKTTTHSEQIPLLSPSQVQQIVDAYRPRVAYSPQEKQAQERKKEMLRKARQAVVRRMQLDYQHKYKPTVVDTKTQSV